MNDFDDYENETRTAFFILIVALIVGISALAVAVVGLINELSRLF